MAYYRKRGKTWSYTIDVGIDPSTGKRKQISKGDLRERRMLS
ncbi:Arm DNA-binding domain-containing protein [Halobacillus shinanisalinarum]|uniref:Arm DNA-binding domain-containing protein n=1 Tax=Halobacillus shinanisalinarum TaxID=2932258 RepID=A0ABY4GU31_9BACI|nr:Arm DNA-binding domain-containing protein [Halobacillus shinanisalinarum]UOQ91446.1 Arm DNA-binding domain-containing protein [Halobacillus shinanisalinarum]